MSRAITTEHTEDTEKQRPTDRTLTILRLLLMLVLCLCCGPLPSTAGQWSYEPYGQAVAAESIHAHPQMKLGHKGLFLDRLDLDSLSPSSGGIWPTLLAPFSDPFYQMRNRDYRPLWGRFNQRDPNQTGQPVLMGSYHGEPIGAPDIAFSLEALYTDGHNLYQYLGSNPLNASDPYGLFIGFLAPTSGMDVYMDYNERAADMGMSMQDSLSAMLGNYGWDQLDALDAALDFSRGDAGFSAYAGVAGLAVMAGGNHSHHVIPRFLHGLDDAANRLQLPRSQHELYHRELEKAFKEMDLDPPNSRGDSNWSKKLKSKQVSDDDIRKVRAALLKAGRRMDAHEQRVRDR